MKIRERLEQIERETLSSFATLSCDNAVRLTNEAECDIRTAFQRDRDRIIHSKSFRRLKHKTQVFLSPESDHFRTRLTHTLEVAQIARTISRALRLNEDLTEAIALAHDLGHTPFGHAGERALDAIYSGGFKHFEQSARVCERLERDGAGLNLTRVVIDGILHHTRGDFPSTPEGKIVRISDRIAYINHDIDDACAAGVLAREDIPKDIRDVLGERVSERIDSLVKSVVCNSEGADIKMDSETEKAFLELHEFMFSYVYCNPLAKSEEEKVDGFVAGIYEFLLKNPDRLNDEYALVREQEGIERAAVDYIAGMTDHFAVATYNDIYVPKSFKI